MNKQRTYFARTPGSYDKPILINAVERDKCQCYAPGLVDLMQEAIAGKLPGLNVKWTLRLLRSPLPNDASVDEWRAHFIRMVEEYHREHDSAA